MNQPILTIPDPLLRKKAQPVEKITDEILRLVQDMKDTMYYEPGCGLAAPQIGVSLRVIVYDSPEDKLGFQVLINPRIVMAQGRQKGPEGCLSVPEITADVVRAVVIRIQGLRIDGAEVTLDLKDFTARIIQHEIDHLDGILYIDRLAPAERSIVDKKLKKIISGVARL